MSDVTDINALIERFQRVCISSDPMDYVVAYGETLAALRTLAERQPDLDYIDCYRIIRAAGRSDAAKAKAISDAIRQRIGGQP